MWCF
ncbi:hypothetical protein LINGRAHAP2_LOCUS4785 [Linum grandiflorum]